MSPVPTLVLAGPADDALVGSIAHAIEASGSRVVVVGLDPTEPADGAHEARFRAALSGVSGDVIVGGFSIGARIAARLSGATAPRGLLCLGYPFHRAGDPQDRHGLETLSGVTVRTRIIQGSRDNHGTEAEVNRYRLPDTVEIIWLRDGNHRFEPRQRSGLTREAHVETATAAAIEFIGGR